MPKGPLQLEFHDLLSGDTRQVDGAFEVEAAPGLYVEGLPPASIPRVGFVAMVPEADNRYRPVLKTFGASIRLTHNIGRMLGISSKEKEDRAIYFTIKRLIWAGFVVARTIGPGSYLLDLNSFWAFWRACSKPGFWTKERRERYRAAMYGPPGEEAADD